VPFEICEKVPFEICEKVPFVNLYKKVHLKKLEKELTLKK